MPRDPKYTPFGSGQKRPSPRLELLERCWRLRALPTGRELVCGIFETPAGLEVRAGYRDDLLHSQMCPDLLSARVVAERMKRTLIDDLGGVKEFVADGFRRRRSIARRCVNMYEIDFKTADFGETAKFARNLLEIAETDPVLRRDAKVAYFATTTQVLLARKASESGAKLEAAILKASETSDRAAVMR